MAGIYLHIPFCKQACIYCDFHYSTVMKNSDQMIAALAQELVLRKSEVNEEIETIYFGGGTPSVLNAEQLGLLLKTIKEQFEVSSGAEITVEANPDDLSEEKLKELFDLGVNRLSIGVQSFFDEHLKWMNRAHSAKESLSCLKNAQRIGFKNITIDLIYGVPIMTDDEWERNIDFALNLGIPHISAYNLTVEEKTVLHYKVMNGESKDVNDEQGERNFKRLREKLLTNGFVHYEISNFGKENFFSQHNTSYWQGKKYLGIGPSAHSYDNKNRSWNIRNNAQYIKAISDGELPSEAEELSSIDQINEHIMIGLRNIWGCKWSYLDQFEVDFQEMKLLISEMQDEGLLELNEQGFRTTEKGMLYADAIATELFVA